MREEVFWHARRPRAVPRALAGEHAADVAVVGGGILGLACAQRLSAGGCRVALVERDFCGAGASGRSSGFVTPASEIELRALYGKRGAGEARRLWEFVLSGVESMRANIDAHGFACDRQAQDSLFVANTARSAREARAEHAARLALGYPSRLYGAGEVRAVLGSSRYAGAVRYGGTFAVDPHAYCAELRALVERAGVAVFEGAPALAIEPGRVALAAGSVRADHVVVCTDRSLPELGALRDELFHAQTFLGLSPPLPPETLRELFPDGPAMVWDSALLYHYFRPTPDGRLLLGGSDLRHTYASGPPASLEQCGRRLLRAFARRFPEAEIGAEIGIEWIWSGMLGVAKDLLPVMGPDPRDPRIWYAGAATGLPWGTALGIYAAERILAGRSDFDRAFSPQREFVIGRRLQALLSKPVSFAICNGVAKLA